MSSVPPTGVAFRRIRKTMDRISQKHRSWNMSRITGRDTDPERRVRSALHRLGFRFRTHSSSLPGRPDVVLKRHRTVVLVHGCYWHRHPRCRLAYTPKSNLAFWLAKFAGNVARDRRDARRLRNLGWRVVTVWECQTQSDNRLIAALTKKMGGFRPLSP
jgi:DNA mismatch endonuclease, patch repair protein